MFFYYKEIEIYGKTNNEYSSITGSNVWIFYIREIWKQKQTNKQTNKQRKKWKENLTKIYIVYIYAVMWKNEKNCLNILTNSEDQ